MGFSNYYEVKTPELCILNLEVQDDKNNNLKSLDFLYNIRNLYLIKFVSIQLS